MEIKILPSLLAADFGALRAACRQAEAAGGDALHLDIMDGHFVPNLSMGPDVVKMATDAVEIPRSVHLMLSNAERYVERFIEAGATSLLVHVEPAFDVAAVLRRIRELGVRSGATLNPQTPAAAVFDHLPLCDEVLCMTVEPGYGGQSFMPEVLRKISAVRREADRQGFGELDIMVDGGIGMGTIGRCATAGANAFVAGSSLYRAEDMKREIAQMRAIAQEQFARG